MSAPAEMFSRLASFKSPRKQLTSWFDLDDLDPVLTVAFISLLTIGVIMVASSSISVADRNYSNPFYYLQRQLVFVAIGIFAALTVFKIRLVQWEKSGMALLLFALFLLVLVLIPGVGKTVNGSTRWLPLGVFNLQVSELVKLFLVIYVAGYLVRHGDAVRSSLWGFLKPMLMVGLAGLLLLIEPDFGATVVIMGTVLGMTFLAGARFVQFMSFVMIFASAAMLLVVTSPYRMQRLTSFANPWADPFDSGFQLTQSLIAIGTGGWFGTGLGGSVQKLFYLPESHTDFLFAVLSEELGFVGVSFVVLLYAALFFRSLKIAAQAERAGNYFAAYLAYGIGIWLSMQAVINMGVNVGLLPTKGLTLPLMSYGGSSLIVCCAAIGLLMRIHYETNGVSRQASKGGARKATRTAGRIKKKPATGVRAGGALL
ncbi:MAG: putative lipid II flippase FtsW [Gammaproteobacteria bacterium]|nr:putative lipid II flippase FtsW [Gammaproteobacteria bacterium]NNJ50635.1 putative lipid II flippase FtsW [Gammaproteobacteria bacterium]